MPNTTSAKKALRQSERRHVKNTAVKRRVKDVTKRYKRLVAGGNIEEAQRELPSVYKTLDKAAKAGVIKKNKSGRLKSRLATKLKQAPVAPSVPEGEGE